MKSLLTLCLATSCLIITRPSLSHAQSSELTLDAVLATALANHPLIEAARARVSGARGARRSAGALPNPVGTYQVENAAFPGRTQPAGLEKETATFLTLPLEPLFQRWPRVRQANEEIRAAEAELAMARRDVALDAARAFYRVAFAQMSLAAAEETRAGIARLESFNRSRVAEGVAAEGELIRIQVELDRAATDVALESVELMRARADLLPYLGSSDTSGLLVDTLRVAFTAEVAAAAQLPPMSSFMQRARTARPELIEARARAAAAGAEVTFQRTLTVRQVGATFGSKRVGDTRSMIAGISIPIPLFDQNRGEVQRATGERNAAAMELAWTERTVDAQVQAAYRATGTLATQVARLQGTFLTRAEESRKIAITLYEEGVGSLLQVLDATRALGEARLAYYRILFAQRQSALDLSAMAGDDPVSGTPLMPTRKP